MKNNIQESYVTFEVAKLLKEKGFNCNTIGKYIGNQLVQLDGNVVNSTNISVIYSPTTALAIKWIRENFDIYISIRVGFGEPVWYDAIIQWENSAKYHDLGENTSYPTYEDAENAAIEYTLKNLI